MDEVFVSYFRANGMTHDYFLPARFLRTESHLVCWPLFSLPALSHVDIRPLAVSTFSSLWRCSASVPLRPLAPTPAATVGVSFWRAAATLTATALSSSHSAPTSDPDLTMARPCCNHLVFTFNSCKFFFFNNAEDTEFQNLFSLAKSVINQGMLTEKNICWTLQC